MAERMTERDIQLLAAQAQHEFTELMQHFTNALNNMDKLEKTLHDPAQIAIMRRTIIELQDSYLSTTMLHSLVTKQSAVIRQLIVHYRASRDAYAQGWADRLSDLLLRLSSENDELRSEVERILRTDDL